MQVVVKLSVDEVQAIIKDHLHKKGYVAKNVRFRVEERGSDPRELDLHHEFVGVDVDAEQNT